MRFSFVLCSILVGIISAAPFPQTDVTTPAQGAEVVVVSADNKTEGDKVTIEFNPQETTEESQPAEQTSLDPAELFKQLWNLRRPNEDEHADDAKYEEYEKKTTEHPEEVGQIDF